MTIKMVEVDCGPGGMVWELHSDDFEFLRSYPDEGAMLNDAALIKRLGHDIRFHTQAEYNLEVQVEIMLENELFQGRV